MSLIDVVVIGAGAAGIAAGKRLADAPGIAVRVLEAAPRLGGRALTVHEAAIGAPLDLGCGWLHGAHQNAWHRIAGRLGFTIDRTPAPWDQQFRDLGFPAEEQAAYREAASAFYAAVAAAAEDPEDRALGDLLPPGGPWNGLLNAVSTYVSGAELDRASLHDAERYDPGAGPDWRVVEGYGRLVATYADGLAVETGTAATRVDHSAADRVRIETGRGTLEARAVIITASTNVIAAEAIRFTPALPEKLEAAARLPLGLADKVFLQVAAPEDLPRDGHLVGNPRRAATGAYHLRPFGRPVVEAYLGGRLAADLEAAGPEAAAAFATDELVGLFGESMRRRLSLVRATRWGQESTIRGSYAYAEPGAADGRARLAAPVDGRLFFAGEACAAKAFTTAHGAFETGVAAAEAALAALAPA